MGRVVGVRELCSSFAVTVVPTAALRSKSDWHEKHVATIDAPFFAAAAAEAGVAGGASRSRFGGM